MADATLLATDLLLSYPAASGATAFDRLARSRAAAPAAEAVLMTALRQARSTPDHGCTKQVGGLDTPTAAPERQPRGPRPRSGRLGSERRWWGRDRLALAALAVGKNP